MIVSQPSSAGDEAIPSVTAGPLRVRVEAAIGPDRILDADIAKAFGVPHGEHEEIDVEARSIETWPEIAPHYTSSLDDALALVERALRTADIHPRDGWIWGVSLGLYDPPYFAALTNGNIRHPAYNGYWGGTRDKIEFVGATPALALLAALFSALEAKPVPENSLANAPSQSTQQENER